MVVRCVENRGNWNGVWEVHAFDMCSCVRVRVWFSHRYDCMDHINAHTYGIAYIMVGRNLDGFRHPHNRC